MPGNKEMDDAIKQMGGIAVIAKEMNSYNRRLRAFEARREDLLKEYPDQWVAVYKRKVRVAKPSLEAMVLEIDRLGIPRRETIVAFMDTEPKTWVL